MCRKQNIYIYIYMCRSTIFHFEVAKSGHPKFIKHPPKLSYSSFFLFFKFCWAKAFCYLPFFNGRKRWKQPNQKPSPYGFPVTAPTNKRNSKLMGIFFFLSQPQLFFLSPALPCPAQFSLYLSSPGTHHPLSLPPNWHVSSAAAH